jgi:hypothetical protein
MTDEAAVLLRIAVFGFLVAVVYWFISYEPLGTVGFLVLGAGPTFVGAYLVRHQQPWRLESSWDMLRRFAGLPPPDRAVEEEPTEEDIEVLPSLTIWPFVLALGLTTAITGLVYGLWPLIVGAGMAAAAVVGWLSAVNREQRHRQLLSRPATRARRQGR